ncbi:hypothetical protein ACJX0J_023631, partial [Zea mays]
MSNTVSLQWTLLFLLFTSLGSIPYSKTLPLDNINDISEKNSLMGFKHALYLICKAL